MKLIKELIPNIPSSFLNRISINSSTSKYIYEILNKNNNSHSNLTNTRYEIKGPVNDKFWTHYISNDIEQDSTIGDIKNRDGTPPQGWNITTNLHGHLYNTNKFSKISPIYNFQFRIRSYAALSKKYINNIEHTLIYPQKDTCRKSWLEFKCSLKSKNTYEKNYEILTENKINYNNNYFINNYENKIDNNFICDFNCDKYKIDDIGKVTLKRRILLDNMTILKLIYIWNTRYYQDWLKNNFQESTTTKNTIQDIFNQIREEAYDEPLNNNDCVNDIINILNCLYKDEHPFGFDRCSTYTRRAQILNINENKEGEGIKIEMTEDRNLQIYSGDPQQFIENGVLNPSKLILFTPKLVIPTNFIEFKIPYFDQSKVNNNVRDLYCKILNVINNMNVKGNTGKTKYVKKFIYGK
tara:strand:+ start:855 stop:2084 length:1230 start_codon:yes stop_codon:yes gene_type:complete